MAQNNIDFRRKFGEIIGSYGFYRQIDEVMSRTGGGLFRSSYGNPNNGDIVYIPSMFVTGGVRLFIKSVVVNCGEHTFDTEEMRIENDPNDEELRDDIRIVMAESVNNDMETEENEGTEIDNAQ
jgi:hypothetical protein